MLERADLTGRPLCAALTGLADAWLAGLLGDQPGVALVGVGSVGRREVCPGSDLDLLLLHDGRPDVAKVADGLWYPVWDSGVPLDHSVRTVPEAVAVADADLKAVLGLLDARHVAGDPALTATLLAELRAHWRKRSPRALVELRESVAARHARAGEAAFLLEPDLKEARGGLRDLQAMRAVAAAWVTDPPGPRVTAAYDTLLEVRVELHRATGRGSDLLTMADQDAVAPRLGYDDATALMSAVSDAARTLAYATDEAFVRVDAWLAGRRRRLTRPARPAPVAEGLAVHGGELVLGTGADLRDPVLPWRAAAEAAERGLPLGAATLERLAGAPAPSDPWPRALRDAVVRLLGTGAAAVPLVEALDQHGLVVRAIPEWSAVRNRSQRNPYHRFTVDRHLVEAAAAAAPLARRVSRPDLLLVGALLHDVGKGFPGDHSTSGVEVVHAIGTRMGFAPPDVATLAVLVRHHLLLAETATRRDLDDPATVSAVAAAVQDRETLHLLHALTEADSLATGPSAWSDWKGRLLADLVARVDRALAGAPAGPPAPRPIPEPGVRLRDGVLTVVVPDRPGLFWRVAGVLALHRLDVRSATAWSAGGTAAQEFAVEPAFGAEPDEARLVADVARALAGRLAVEARLAERARAYPAPARTAPPVVVVDGTASETATVVEVRAHDAVGLLFRITRALADCDLDIRSAKVATLGAEVVDTFYVQRLDAEHAAEVRRAVLAALG